jgi:tRNA nucleotidyltransferase (CCA-adding enzyme)
MTKPLPIPDELRAILAAVRRVGRPRLVGGGVRDWLLGLEPKDFDVEVAGVDFEALQRSLAPFGATDVVGRSFGVIKVRGAMSGSEYDFSLPRRESKTGAGHRGFAVAPDPALSDAEAAARRDFTVNAIACDPLTGELIDPHGGVADLHARVLRHTSAAFSEDPLRVLRAFQLAARFDFSLAPETAALSRSIAGTFAELPVERVWGEWEKWAVKSIKPSRGLGILEETGWLMHFPEIAALRGTPQEPEWHPEGDALTHTQHCLDALVALAEWRDSAAARRRLLMFAVLAHDFGKPGTTVRLEKRGALRWASPGHEAAGAPLAENFLRRIGAPLELDAPVCALVAHHLVHHHGPDGDFSDSHVRRLARKLTPATIDDLALVMTADSQGRPPLHSPETLGLIGKLRHKAHALALARKAPQPLVLGRHLLTLGRTPGPDFKRMLDAAFEAQLDGAFIDEAGGVVWLRAFLEQN